MSSMQANACIFRVGMGIFYAISSLETMKMKLHETVRNYFRNRRAVAELSALDDRSLSDIGVSRSHIRSAVEGRR